MCHWAPKVTFNERQMVPKSAQDWHSLSAKKVSNGAICANERQKLTYHERHCTQKSVKLCQKCHWAAKSANGLELLYEYYFDFTFGLLKVPEQMAHFVALEENKDPLPKGDEPRPDEEAEDEETRSVLVLELLALVLVKVIEAAEAKPDSWSWPRSWPLLVPLAKTMPVKLSIEGVGEAAEPLALLTRTPLLCGWLWCCKVAAISDCQAINLQNQKNDVIICWHFWNSKIGGKFEFRNQLWVTHTKAQLGGGKFEFGWLSKRGKLEFFTTKIGGKFEFLTRFPRRL